MLAAIRFDDQPRSRAGEVHYIAFNGKLPAEFPALKPFGPEQLPKTLFSVGLIPAKSASPIFEAPSPQPLPRKGGGALLSPSAAHSPITLGRPSSPIATKVKVAWVTRSVSSPARMRRQAETSIFIELRPTETTSA